MLNLYMEEPGMVCSDWLRENEGFTPAQLKQFQGLSQMRGVEIDQLNGAEAAGFNGVEIEALNGVAISGNSLGLVPDWQFRPLPPPIGTGKYSEVTYDLPGGCPSWGISGAMGLENYSSLGNSTDMNVLGVSPKVWAVIMGALFIHSLLRVPLAIVDGVHGYKRNDEDGASAAAWGAFGFLFPISTTIVAVAQGYGKRK